MKKVFIQLILSVQNREKDLYKKKALVGKDCCVTVQFFLEILTISVMIGYKCSASIFVLVEVVQLLNHFSLCEVNTY